MKMKGGRERMGGGAEVENIFLLSLVGNNC